VHGEVAEHLADPFAAQVRVAHRLVVPVQFEGPEQAQPEPVTRGGANGGGSRGGHGGRGREAKALADGQPPESHRRGHVMITAA